MTLAEAFRILFVADHAFVAVWVILLSGTLGAAELMSRYRDAPMEAICSRAGWVYLALNVVIGLVALFCINVLQLGGLTLEGAAPEDHGAIRFYQVVAAGLGGAAILRSALAKTKIGDQEISIGPAFLIDTILGTVDREIDRKRADLRMQRVPEIMRDIPASVAVLDFAELCLASMQNLSTDELSALQDRIAAAKAIKFDLAESRSVLIGFALSRYVGLDVMARAAATLGPRIQAAKKAGGADGAAREKEVHAQVQSFLSQTPKPAPEPAPKPAPEDV